MKKTLYKKHITQKEVIFFSILILSVLIRLHYICFISIYDMQHDVGTTEHYYGHLGYITYFLQNWQLPDFDVREAFQFWHPPLHHFLSAAFLKLVWTFFPSYVGNYEPLQVLTLIYITFCLLIVWKLLNLWNFKGYSLFIPFLIIAFHPTFIMLSGSVNNDTLCFLLTLLSVYLAILWYQTPTYKLIIACGLSMGFAMSAKGTAFIAAMPIAFLFLAGLSKYGKKILGQLVIFGFISLPLGLWWYIRNYILFNVPFNYIYRTDPEAIGYLGGISLWRRILDFDPRRFSFRNIYIQFEGQFMEINPITALLKSAVYGQCWFNYNVYIRIIAYPLIFIWITFIVLSLIALPNSIKKAGNMLIPTLSIIILFITQFISYYTFCIEYPFVWTMDIRYAISLLICHTIWLAAFIDQYPKHTKKILHLAFMFVIITIIIFFMFSFTTFG